MYIVRNENEDRDYEADEKIVKTMKNGLRTTSNATFKPTQTHAHANTSDSVTV